MGAFPGHDPKAQCLARYAALHPHPEQVRDALFRSGPFFDARDLVQVRYEMIRRFRIDGLAAAGVAQSFGVSRQLLYGLAQAFQAGGLLALVPRKRGPKGARVCTDEVLAFVRARQARSPQPSLDELLADVRQGLGVRLHRRTLQRRLARQGKKLRRLTRPTNSRLSRPST